MTTSPRARLGRSSSTQGGGTGFSWNLDSPQQTHLSRSPAARPVHRQRGVKGHRTRVKTTRSSPAPRAEQSSPSPAQPTCSGAEQRRELAACPAHVPFLEPLPAPPRGSLPGPGLPARRGSGEQSRLLTSASRSRAAGFETSPGLGVYASNHLPAARA